MFEKYFILISIVEDWKWEMHGMSGGSWQLSGYNNTCFYLTLSSLYCFVSLVILVYLKLMNGVNIYNRFKIRVEKVAIFFTSRAHTPYLHCMWIQCVVKLSVYRAKIF